MSLASEVAVGIGHVVLSVRNVGASARFYADLGLAPFQQGNGQAILELRGGTHLILLAREGDSAGAQPERVDLMIAGRSKKALKNRAQVLERGLHPSRIPGTSLYGHYMFRLLDPDGNEVVVATSHSAPAKKYKAGQSCDPI